MCCTRVENSAMVPTGVMDAVQSSCSSPIKVRQVATFAFLSTQMLLRRSRYASDVRNRKTLMVLNHNEGFCTCWSYTLYALSSCAHPSPS